MKIRWLHSVAALASRETSAHEKAAALVDLEDVERTVRRVLGGAHPLMIEILRDIAEVKKQLSSEEYLAFLALAAQGK